MGGRGAWSFSSPRGGGELEFSSDNYFAAGSLNTGNAKGSSIEKSVHKFRNQLSNSPFEYAAWVDSQGYFHKLTSDKKSGSVKPANLALLAKEKGIKALVHNHPSEKGREFGGSFSEADIVYAVGNYEKTKGRVNAIYATAKEGVYKATISKAANVDNVKRAMKKAEKSIKGKLYASEWKMWESYHNKVTKELKKAGVNVEFEKSEAQEQKFKTQNIGTIAT